MAEFLPTLTEELRRFDRLVDDLRASVADARIGRLVRHLVEQGVAVRVYANRIAYSAFLQRDSETLFGESEDGLYEAIAAAYGLRPTKRCNQCHLERSLDEFSNNAANKFDGKLVRCKFCERKRVRAYYQRRHQTKATLKAS